MQLRGVTPEGMQMPSDAALSDITYAGMQTREVDFELARQELASFLWIDPVDDVDEFGVE